MPVKAVTTPCICPSKAMPDGPVYTATTFAITNPIAILARVSTPVEAITFISLLIQQNRSVHLSLKKYHLLPL